MFIHKFSSSDTISYISKYVYDSDSAGFFFILLTILSIPLSIFMTEIFFIVYLSLFFTSHRYKFLKFDIFSLTVVFVVTIGFISFVEHYSSHAFFDLKQMMYLMIAPFISAYIWNTERYILALRFFIIGMSANLFFGIIEAFGVKIIDTHGQGPLGLINFHIYSSMLISMSLLLLLYDFFYKRIISSLSVRSVMFLGFLWQIFATQGRTGQGLLLLLAPLVIFLNIKKYRYIYPTLAIIIVGITISLSSKAINMWYTAYSQFNSIISGGYHYSDIGLRYLFAKSGFIMFVTHPFSGVGIGQFRKTFFDLIADHKIPEVPQYVHGFVGPTSSYIAFFSEFGSLGVISILLLIYASYKKIICVKDKNIRNFGLLFFLWFFIGSFSDTIIWREVIVVPFLIFISATNVNAGYNENN